MTDTATTDISTLRINGQRLWDSLMELAKIGETPKAASAGLP
jgi:N-carbamoyl-L-amino-acid hydrolase